MPNTKLGSVCLEKTYPYYYYDKPLKFNGRIIYELSTTQTSSSLSTKGAIMKQYFLVNLTTKIRKAITKDEYLQECRLIQEATAADKSVIYSIQCVSIEKVTFKESNYDPVVINHCLE
jgi:hypothetical protein